MCFVMFKFSTQQLLRKRNGTLSPYCRPHSPWFILSVCSRTSDSEERHWGFPAVPKGWTWEEAEPVVLGRGCSASPSLGMLCPAGAPYGLGSSGGSWNPSAFPVLVFGKKCCQAQGMCLNELDSARGWEQPPGADKSWGCWKRQHCAVWGHLCEGFLCFPICGRKKTLYEKTFLLYL